MAAYDLINPGIIKLLHSSMHRTLSKRLMTVSYQGRKSGKDYCVPVSYYRDGDTVYCFTNGRWRINFREVREAVLRLQGEDYPARGQIDDLDREQQVELMTRYFEAVPQDKKFYGVRKGRDGQLDTASVEQATHVVEIIRFELA